MTNMNDIPSEIKGQALFEEFQGILGFVQTAFQQGRTAHEVETGLWERIRKLGHGVYGAWLNLFGDGDAGDRIVLDDGREVRRLEALHRREIQNVFGFFELRRAVYATREGQKIAAVPLDERLGLPQGRHSYLLQDWEQHLAVEVPFATDSKTLSRILDFTPSVHTLERHQRALAPLAGEFWKDLPPPPAAAEGELLVCTADGKGVPMRGGAKAPTGVAPSLSKFAVSGSFSRPRLLAAKRREENAGTGCESLIKISTSHQTCAIPCFSARRSSAVVMSGN